MLEGKKNKDTLPFDFILYLIPQRAIKLLFYFIFKRKNYFSVIRLKGF